MKNNYETMTGPDEPTSWEGVNQHRNVQVLLLLEREANERALRTWAPSWFEFLEGTPTSIPETFDLCIVDEPSFGPASATLQQRKEEAKPAFLPILFVANSPDVADSEIWRYVDEVIQSPIQKRNLQGRIEVLLRARESSVELKRQRDRLDQFAGVIAHDLRNPLGIAMGYLTVAREKGDETAFDRVETALDRMQILIDDVLGLARRGGAALDVGPTELAASVDRAWANVEAPRATLRNVVATEDSVLADTGQLMELLENLFRNSVEHGSTGSRTTTWSDDTAENGSTDEESVTIDVGLLPSGRGVYVADDGPGIPEDRREELFEFGYTTTGGTGFGLAIVKQIVAAHGWTIEVIDSETGGARFEIRGVVRADD